MTAEGMRGLNCTMSMNPQNLKKYIAKNRKTEAINHTNYRSLFLRGIRIP
jgi:hypothetical protein